MRKPYFVKRLQCYYVKNADGKEIRLDPDEEKAYELWQVYLNSQRYEGDEASVLGLVDKFLDDKQQEWTKSRYDVESQRHDRRDRAKMDRRN